MGSLSSTRLKKRMITWTAIVAVLVLTFYGIFKLGLHFSSDILFQMVKRETNGYYQISFEEIDIDLWERAIKLKKVLLKPDSSKDFHEKGLNNLYDLELGGLNIDLESISSIYTDQQLVIQHVRIIDPQIHIIREDNAPKESFSLQTGNLYKEISDYLKVLRIDFFTIENAEIAHSPSEFGLGKIDFSIENLLIDSASRPRHEFYSESIEMEIHDQRFKLGDSIHQITFDRLLLSTADSVLTFENLSLKPISEQHGTFDDLDDKIVYDITIPELKLKGVDYFSAYRNNHLEMEELSLLGANIFLEEQTHDKSNKREKKDNSILKQLIEVFDEVKIGKMRLVNTNLDLTTNEDYNQNYQHVQSKRVDIVLYNIFLDSSNYHFDQRQKYFEDLDLIIKDYSSYLPDSIHTINFDLLQLSSFDSTLIFKNFNISNNGKGSSSDMFLTIDLPLLSLKGLNYLDILINQKLLIEEMRLQNPSIIFESQHEKGKQKDLSPDKIYALIKSQFKILGIKQLRLNQGSFSINNQLRLRRADLWISNFNMDHNSASWYHVLDDLVLDLQDMAINDDAMQMKAGHLRLDRTASRLTLDELTVDYLDQYNSISGDLSSLTLSGVDLDSISIGNYLAFDSIMLERPHFKFQLLKPKEDGLRKHKSRSKFISVVNGQINGIMNDSTAVSLNEINAGFSLGAFNHLHYGDAQQISITSPQSAHQLNIAVWNFSSSDELSLKEIELQSMGDKSLQKMELNGRIPALTLHGLNQGLFWERRKLVGDSLIIDAPMLNLNLNDIAKVFTPRDTVEVEFQKIRLEKAHLMFSDQGQPAIERVEMPKLSLTLEGFYYPEKPLLSADHLIFSDDVRLNVEGFRPVMTNGDSIVIRQLNFNKKEALILIDSLSFNQANSATVAVMPSIKVVGLDLHAYMNKQELKLDSIQLKSSQITISHLVPKGETRDSVNGTPELVDIKYFSSVETEIELRDSLKVSSYALHKGRFEVHEFYAKGEMVWEQFFGYAQFVAVSGRDFSVPIGDGYEVNIDGYSLEYPNNTLTLDQINLTSDFTAAEYSSTLTAQKSWFDVSVDGVTISGLEMGRALGEREYNTEKILMEGLNALVYRDKSVPFHSSTVKELPQSMLRAIDTWIYVDTLQVKGDITYQEKPDGKEEIGALSFNSIDASLFQITSVDSMARKPMRFVSTGRLADTANFVVNAVFDMHDPKDKFTLTGQVDQMELRALNNILRPVANINIKDGYAEQIKFDLVADKELARGAMDFRYQHLKIQILNPEVNDLKGSNQGFKTFFANTFVVKHKNPNFIFLRPGVIFQPRDSSRAIFQYWSKALLSGVVSSIGINKSKKAEKKYGRAVGKKNR